MHSDTPVARGRVIRRQRLLGLVTVFTLSTASLLVLPACGQVLGDVLSGLFEQVNAVISNAVASTQSAVVETSDILIQDINDAESAFATQLGTVIDQLSSDARATLNRLETDVMKLQQGIVQALQEATKDAQLLLNQIPFTNKNPQLKSYDPQFITPGSGGTVRVHLSGNWPYAIQNNETPKMRFGSTVLEPSQLGTFDMSFDVPAGAFAAGTPTGMADASFEVDVAFERGSIFKTITPGAFRLLIVTLPPSPVQSLSITLNSPQLTTQTSYQRNPATTSGAGSYYRLQSYAPCAEDILPTIHIKPDPEGWQLIKSSFNIVETVIKNSDEVFINLTINTPSATDIDAKTEPGSCDVGLWTSGCGDVTFYITYQEQRTIQTGVNSQTQQITLGWGGQVVISGIPKTSGTAGVPPWRVDAVMFDGRHESFVDTGDDNSLPPYLHVVNQGGAVQISAPDPSQLHI